MPTVPSPRSHRASRPSGFASARLSWQAKPEGADRLQDAIQHASDTALTAEIELAAQAGVDLRDASRQAVRENRLAGFRDLVGRTGDLDAPNPQGSTLLMLTILGRCALPIAQWLIRHGANVHHRNVFGEDALYLACHENAPSLVRPLLNAGVDPNVVTPRGSTAMLELVNHAVRTTVLSPALRVLARRTSTAVWTAQDPNGLTPLMRAYSIDRNGFDGTLHNDHLVKLLLDHGAGVAMKVGDRDPLHPSPWTMTANDPIRRRILEKGFALVVEREQAVLRAAMDAQGDPAPSTVPGRARL